VVHVAKHLEPYQELAHSADKASRMLTMGEYVAGFVPLGYWLASGRIAGCVTTTGAATKLGGSGMTDAKLHNIPAVYLIALNSTLSIGNAPLQDVSEYGMNVVPQLQAELGEGLVVVDNMNKLEEGLRRVQRVLKHNKPVALGFDAGEYSLNLAKIPAGHVYHFTDMREAYGHKNGEFRHRVAHEYRQVRGDVGLVLEEVLPRLAETCKERPNTAPAPVSLNTREPERNKRPGTVDFQEFYEKIDKMWPPGSFGVDDVCIAYKDRQWATQRPNPHIPFW